MVTVPCRRVGNLFVMFANQKIYRSEPWTREAALDAVALHYKVHKYRRHHRYNIAAIL